MTYRLFLAAFLPVFSAAQAQTTSFDCMPPALPSTVGSPDLLAEFGDEIRAEFNQYFGDAQTYLNCLAAAQGSASSEINEMLSVYTEIFPRQ